MWWALWLGCSEDAALQALEARIDTIGATQTAVRARLEAVEERLDADAASQAAVGAPEPPQPGEIQEEGPDRWSVDRRLLLRVRNAPAGLGAWVTMRPSYRGPEFEGWWLTDVDMPLQLLGFHERDVVTSIDGELPTIDVIAQAWRNNTVTTEIVVTVRRKGKSRTFTYEVR